LSKPGHMEAHFVTFFSPGTFVPETSDKPIASWDVAEAVRMARGITERYNATPYGFRFTTRTRGPKDLDSRQTAQSRMYYLGGKVETLAEVKARATKEDRILVSNMECNRIARVITNTNSWRFTGEFKDEDVVLDWPAAPLEPQGEKAKGQP
jgi:hypothetical protein